MRRIFLLLGGLICTIAVSAQPDTVTPVTDTISMKGDLAVALQDTLLFEKDTVAPDPIMLTPEKASAYIDSLLEHDRLWRPSGDSMKQSLVRLNHHYQEPVDSVVSRLLAFSFDSLAFSYTDIIETENLPLRWLNDSSFIVDTVRMEREPLVFKQTIIRHEVDSTLRSFTDSIPFFRSVLDSLVRDPDTLTSVFIDTAWLAAKNIQLHRLTGGKVSPPLLPPGSSLRFRFTPDSSEVILSNAWRARVAGEDSPFYIVPGKQMPDSLRAAIQVLHLYTTERDSILIFINDMHGGKSPFWLTSGDSDLYRFWIKNYKNDSITVWLGNPDKNEITLFLEEEVNIDRLEIEPPAKIPIATIRPPRKLVNVDPLKVIPVYWEYDFSSAFAFNQTYLSNWSKGGENSVATMLDISGEATYTDKEAKTEWTSNGRLKYGSIITEEYGLRTNTDQLEFNSKFNKVIKDKIDFSSVFYMKNQLARGYNYPNDSVVVSKFLNPGTFTLGVGIEYKPFKKTVINYSPLSYKNTFMLDTTLDQTAHGIAADKKVRQEMGGQLVVKNTVSIFDGLEMRNSLRLFSNYFNNPMNVDVDWEVNLEKRINWYFTVNLNLHLIYDDDIRFPVMDEQGDPVKWPDGSIKKSPKMQFKEFVGLTFSFKF